MQKQVLYNISDIYFGFHLIELNTTPPQTFFDARII